MQEPDNLLDSVLNDTSEELSHKGRYTNHYKQYNILETDTYQMVELKTALNSRKLRPYLKRIGISESGHCMDSINSYILGKTPLMGSYVFMARTAVQPSRWYYAVDEQLPQAISFLPKFTEERLRYEDTVGHQKLRELSKLYKVPSLAGMYGVSTDSIKNVLYKRKDKNGRMIFKIMPPAEFIITFRHVINPDYWFIFPEELTENLNKNKLSDFLINQVCNLIKEKYNLSREEAFNRIASSETNNILKNDEGFSVNKKNVTALSKTILEMWESENLTGNPKNSKLYRDKIKE